MGKFEPYSRRELRRRRATWLRRNVIVVTVVVVGIAGMLAIASIVVATTTAGVAKWYVLGIVHAGGTWSGGSAGCARPCRLPGRPERPAPVPRSCRLVDTRHGGRRCNRGGRIPRRWRRLVLLTPVELRLVVPSSRGCSVPTLEDYKPHVISAASLKTTPSGYQHADCPAPGSPARVMLQQTLGLDGCRPNGWPATVNLMQ